MGRRRENNALPCASKPLQKINSALFTSETGDTASLVWCFRHSCVYRVPGTFSVERCLVLHAKYLAHSTVFVVSFLGLLRLLFLISARKGPMVSCRLCLLACSPGSFRAGAVWEAGGTVQGCQFATYPFGRRFNSGGTWEQKAFYLWLVAELWDRGIASLPFRPWSWACSAAFISELQPTGRGGSFPMSKGMATFLEWYLHFSSLRFYSCSLIWCKKQHCLLFASQKFIKICEQEVLLDLPELHYIPGNRMNLMQITFFLSGPSYNRSNFVLWRMSLIADGVWVKKLLSPHSFF